MNTYNLSIIQEEVLNMLSNKFDHITFEAKISEDEKTLTISTPNVVTLKGHDDEIFVELRIFAGGIYDFRLVFDEIEKTEENLSLVNDLNNETIYFKAFINKKDFLTLENCGPYYDADGIRKMVFEFLQRFEDLSDSEALKELTRRTN